MRPIDADALFEQNESTDKVLVLGRSGGKAIALAERLMRERVNTAPTLTVADLLPKERAMWIPHYNGGIDRREYRCSKCWNGSPNNQDPRCLNCGSEMLQEL